MENKEFNDPKSTNQNVVDQHKLKTAKKEGLTRGALTTGIISFILLVGLGILFYSRYNRDHNEQLTLMETQKVTFTEQLTARDSMINDWLTTFDQIDKNLSAIKQKENILSMKSTSTEFSKDKKNQILEDIKAINTLIDENKKKIANLSAQLKKSGGTITGLQTRITELEASMTQFESQVSELKTVLASKDVEITQLNTNVVALRDTLTMKSETISNQISKMNEAFLVSGTYKDLKEKGLLSKEGGFLGLGRKENLIQDFPDGIFEKIDVTQTKTIAVNSKNVKLITEHPSGSYELVREGENNIAYIEIKDPDEFWRISKYAVVEITK
ncbi:MAG: hypothetical protein WAL29_09810 [Bacteroidales bacterium]